MLSLDAARRPVLNQEVDELIVRLGKVPGLLGTDTKRQFDHLIRSREAGAELVRRLSAQFPDLKDRIGPAVDPR